MVVNNAGVHAVIEHDRNGEGYQISSVLRGGQIARRVVPMDTLISVDGVAVYGLPIAQVKSMIRGPEGSAIRLLLSRPGVGSFETTIFRTSSELQDTQLCLLQEINSMLTCQDDPNDPASVYETMIQNSWRNKDSMDGKMYMSVVELIRELKKQLIMGASESEMKETITRLQLELASANLTTTQMRKEMKDREYQEIVPVTMTIRYRLDELQEDTERRQAFKRELQEEISKAWS
ncbi:hypothetical protein GUITHDRAFT_105451 [Guillardia theta CCMP2712]|uniref:PDZ domain-containing protein n=1 Tax=Guillardia theta (strain CCMP2712) TaxID=905079 RepID=L1JKJ4_GUITC|nr:hypothetical protein GUITHDRAFT_105451 [Guillardia theta CCMP2712]EKX48827.1 hypothetical protein GUITHDRAFT_105451 [Guillardia theta CCMP2712]|eukprot:XP_005835807.1 hypothetical protein GUITHDRAFT_105451 [Guillardia theta CCMP2712]